MVALAAADAAATGDVLGAVESLDAVYCMSWPYDDLPGRLADALGIDPARRHYSGIGGTMPQTPGVGRGRSPSVAGELDVAAGVRGRGPRHQAAAEEGGGAAGLVVPPSRAAARSRSRRRSIPSEVAHEVFQAWLTFATRDVARRARLGIAPDDYRRRIGELLAPMSRGGGRRNPNAWFPIAHDAAELITPDARQPHGRLPLHQDHDVDHGRRHGRRP